MSKLQPISRRQLLSGGLTALAAAAVTPARAAVPPPETPYSTPPPVPSAQNVPRGLAAVTNQLSGVGVYVGNDWFNWDDNARRFAMATARAQGFDFIAPKIGGYGRTWYTDVGHLRKWVDDAHGMGLGFAPFIYTIPETGVADAKLSAQIARIVGLANVDMEDEWGAHEKTGTPGYKGAEMAEFGRIYRSEAGDAPIICNGYGDPITRFGRGADGFPNGEMMQWADAYSPQWYIGVYSRYKKGGLGASGVKAALDWGKDECKQAMGDFPLIPSVDLASTYWPGGLMPVEDIAVMMADLRTYNAPIFVWEYNLMTPTHAEALLGPPKVENLRVGRVRQTAFEVLWDTHVPARSIYNGKVGKRLNLTHTEGAGKLTAGTATVVKVGATSGGGEAAIVPLTVATAPATPGLYVQSVAAARTKDGHIALAITLENTAQSEARDIKLTAVSVDGATVISPTALPFAVGGTGPFDWASRTTDRTELAVIVDKVAANAKTLTLTVMGTSSLGQDWTATLPIEIA